MEFTECKMRGVLSPLCKCPSRELWRREASIDQTIQSARDEMTKCERNLRATVGKVGRFCNLNWFTVGVARKGDCECSDH